MTLLAKFFEHLNKGNAVGGIESKHSLPIPKIVSVREKKKEREKVCMCECVCVRWREREKERERRRRESERVRERREKYWHRVTLDNAGPSWDRGSGRGGEGERECGVRFCRE